MKYLVPKLTRKEEEFYTELVIKNYRGEIQNCLELVKIMLEDRITDEEFNTLGSYIGICISRCLARESRRKKNVQ